MNDNKLIKYELTYDYKNNLEKLKEKYENKIKESSNYWKCDYDDGLVRKGIIEGLKPVINDINKLLNNEVIE